MQATDGALGVVRACMGFGWAGMGTETTSEATCAVGQWKPWARWSKTVGRAATRSQPCAGAAARRWTKDPVGGAHGSERGERVRVFRILIFY